MTAVIIIIIIKMYTLQRKLELDGVNMVIFLVNVNTLGTFSSLIVYSFGIIFFPFPSFSSKEKTQFFHHSDTGESIKSQRDVLSWFCKSGWFLGPGLLTPHSAWTLSRV